MDYRTVFEISGAGQFWKNAPFYALGIVLISSGVGTLVFRKRAPAWRRAPMGFTAFLSCFVAFAVLWTLLVAVGSCWKYTSLADAVRAHRVEVAEGVVTDFVPMPSGGHAAERFCVSGVCFSYSDYSVVPGFNNASSLGGPIREGLPVRVTHVGNDIVKLEVGIPHP
jgi:hypothetical protein